MIRTVSALLYATDKWGGTKILMHTHPRFGVWMGPGGHIEEGELDILALVREVKEETGLDIGKYIDMHFVDYQRVSYRTPDSTVAIHLDNGGILLDNTYYIEVDENLIHHQLKTESNNHMGWYDLDFVINELKMFPDTFQQVLAIRGRVG